MKDWIVYLTFACIGILLVIYNMIKSERNRKKRFLEALKNQWGKFADREYTHEEYECISHYSSSMDNGWKVDNITWNDLDMDRIFKAMNHTQSSLGAEILYDMLRRPVFSSEILMEREKLFQFMAEHEEERRKMQVIFNEIGRTREYAITDYMSMLDEAEKKSNVKHYITAAVSATALISLLWDPVIGIVLLLFAFSFSAFTYYAEKAKVEPYLISFAYLLRMMKAAELLCGEKLEGLEAYQKKLKELNSHFTAFRRTAGLVMSMKNSGSPVDVVMDYIRMFFHVDLIKFNHMVSVLKKNLKECKEMMATMGLLEASIAVASFREALAYYSLPALHEEEKGYFQAENLYHPMIEKPVENSISVERGVLITGSNASGKSTFLKTAAINAILAQTIHTSVSKSYEAPFFRIYSSMSLRDNLAGNESYYMVEIKALHRILEAVQKKETPILAFVDEVLRGTNTVERIAASAHILQHLNQEHVITFAATHDIELTYLLENNFENFHFTEEVEQGDISFNYCLYKGRAQSRNAIKLLSLMGYEKEIVDSAEHCANRFLEKGVWEF